jgi:hypothetical protein
MKMRIAGALLLLAIAAPLHAQKVEMALRLKDELKLTPAQVSQLEAIRKELVAERQEQARNMIDARSRVEAGLVKREDLRKEFEGRRDAVRKTAEARRDRISKIFTDEQKDQLRQRVRRVARQQRMHHGRMQQGRHPRMMRPGRPMPPPRPHFDQDD